MKKYSIILLIIIYFSFIALGLPDALLGSSWNLVRVDLDVPLGTLGLMTVIVYAMSVISTFNAPRLLRFFQTKKITAISILMTGTSLLLISQVQSFYVMLVFALPLGIGAGAIDVSLNHYLAKHYKASHMNYLHAFYGIGVTLGPTVMAYTLLGNSWRMGYMIVGSLLLIIGLFVFLSFPIWYKEASHDLTTDHTHIPIRVMLKKKGALPSILIFLFYVHVESLLGVWIASYIFIEKGVSYATAALFTTTFYLALTIGRILSGILSHRISSKTLIITGEMFILCGSIFLFIRTDNIYLLFFVVGLIGLGTAPVYPNMMYLNNDFFKRQEISRMMSLQMAIGYMGFGILTPLAGLCFDLVSIKLYPFIILIISITLLFITTRYLFFQNKEIG
jgi:fucose permease